MGFHCQTYAGTQGAANDPHDSAAVSNGNLKEAASYTDWQIDVDVDVRTLRIEVWSADELCCIRYNLGLW